MNLPLLKSAGGCLGFPCKHVPSVTPSLAPYWHSAKENIYFRGHVEPVDIDSKHHSKTHLTEPEITEYFSLPSLRFVHIREKK